jgi:cytochrome c oxidase subunit II
MEVEAVGAQWSWSFRLPGGDNKLGATDIRFIDGSNPLGVNPTDSNGGDDLIVTNGEMHLPVGKPVKMLLRSIDVLHDFYVPQIRAKMDLVPGIVSYFWFTPTRIGEFEILCAAFCGIGHPQMRGKMVIDTEADYAKWLAAQQTFEQSRKADIDRDRRVSNP